MTGHDWNEPNLLPEDPDAEASRDRHWMLGLLGVLVAGVLLIAVLLIVLIATDLPEPVVPAISKCGILARLATTASPPMSLPSAKGRR